MKAQRRWGTAAGDRAGLDLQHVSNVLPVTQLDRRPESEGWAARGFQEGQQLDRRQGVRLDRHEVASAGGSQRGDPAISWVSEQLAVSQSHPDVCRRVLTGRHPGGGQARKRHAAVQLESDQLSQPEGHDDAVARAGVLDQPRAEVFGQGGMPRASDLLLAERDGRQQEHGERSRDGSRDRAAAVGRLDAAYDRADHVRARDPHGDARQQCQRGVVARAEAVDRGVQRGRHQGEGSPAKEARPDLARHVSGGHQPGRDKDGDERQGCPTDSERAGHVAALDDRDRVEREEHARLRPHEDPPPARHEESGGPEDSRHREPTAHGQNPKPGERQETHQCARFLDQKRQPEEAAGNGPSGGRRLPQGQHHADHHGRLGEVYPKCGQQPPDERGCQDRGAGDGRTGQTSEHPAEPNCRPEGQQGQARRHKTCADQRVAADRLGAKREGDSVRR